MGKIAFTQVSAKRSGGNAWVKEVLEALASDASFLVETIDVSAKKFTGQRILKSLETVWNLLKLKGKKDIWLRNFYSVVFLNRRRQPGKNVAFIFHIDFSGFSTSVKPFLIMMEKFVFYPQLKKMDAIVVVSEYWKQHFVKRGYKNVHKIYGVFEENVIAVTDQEVADFTIKYGLAQKPIIYLGNCQVAKGAVDAYEALKTIDAHLVTSGTREVTIDAKNLDLSLQEYFVLLKASTIVLTMSKFKEGWCRTTHEAMLLKTPVIGSGMGGMRELLEGGKQIVCEDFSGLKESVIKLLGNEQLRKKIGEDGYAYAKGFTKEKFTKAWLDLMHNVSK